MKLLVTNSEYADNEGLADERDCADRDSDAVSKAKAIKALRSVFIYGLFKYSSPPSGYIAAAVPHLELYAAYLASPFEWSIEAVLQLPLYGLQVESSPLAVDKQSVLGNAREVILHHEAHLGYTTHIGTIRKSRTNLRSYRIGNYDHSTATASYQLHAIAAKFAAQRTHTPPLADVRHAEMALQSEWSIHRNSHLVGLVEWCILRKYTINWRNLYYRSVFYYAILHRLCSALLRLV